MAFPDWIEKIFADCEQEWPEGHFFDTFLGPTYSDGTTGPTSLQEALTSHQKDAMVFMRDGECLHEISIHATGERFSWTLELCYEPSVSISFYTESWQDTIDVCQRLGIDMLKNWAGDDTNGPY